jgi:hypothetical protein
VGRAIEFLLREQVRGQRSDCRGKNCSKAVTSAI